MLSTVELASIFWTRLTLALEPVILAPTQPAVIPPNPQIRFRKDLKNFKREANQSFNRSHEETYEARLLC